MLDNKYLDNKQKNNPYGVEKYFINQIKGFTPLPLADYQSEFLMVVCKATDKELEKMEKDFTEVCWFYPAIDKRLKAYLSYTMDVRAKMILCTWCESIGDLVLYLTYIQYLCRDRKIKRVDSDILCQDFFSAGIIDEPTRKKAWLSQKINKDENGRGSDQLVDYDTAYYSILFAR